jgi:hypothetical protein
MRASGVSSMAVAVAHGQATGNKNSQQRHQDRENNFLKFFHNFIGRFAAKNL